MSFESTITEQDLDPQTQQYLQGLDGNTANRDLDLDVDGLSGGIVARILGLFGVGLAYPLGMGGAVNQTARLEASSSTPRTRP